MPPNLQGEGREGASPSPQPPSAPPPAALKHLLQGISTLVERHVSVRSLGAARSLQGDRARATEETEKQRCESEGEMKRASFLVSDFWGDVSAWAVAVLGLCSILQKNKKAQTVGPGMDQQTQVTATVQLRPMGHLPRPWPAEP